VIDFWVAFSEVVIIMRRLIRERWRRYRWEGSVVLADNQMTDADSALVAGVGAQPLKTGIMRLYGVVMIPGGWVRRCARLLCGHEALLRGPGLGRVLAAAGPFA
jgi:hypothetical protein